MNERIKELIEQANSQHDNFFDLNYKELDVFLEKFAELIVTECLDLLWNSLSISDDHDGTVDGIAYTGKEILTAAKEHFGVKE